VTRLLGLPRLGRSLGQVIHIVDELVKRKIRFTAIKESIHFEGKQDLQTKVMVALFGLFAEVESDLISERTREGLASARAKGRLLGRPKGVLGKSRPGWERERNPPSLAKAGLKGVHRQDCRRHATHHSSLYQDKAVTPTSLKDTFTPIWSGPFQRNSTIQRGKLCLLFLILMTAYCESTNVLGTKLES
jgi:hypothetical protein